MFCDTSVAIIKQNSDENYQAIRGTRSDPFIIAEILVHKINNESAINKMFKFGNFYYLPNHKSSHKATHSPAISFKKSQLFSYADNGGHLDDFIGDVNDGEDPRDYADSCFLWKNNQWYYINIGGQIGDISFIPLTKKIKSITKLFE